MKYSEFLKLCIARAALLQPATAEVVTTNLKAMLENATGENFQKNIDEYKALLQRAHLQDVGAMAEVSQIRTFRVDNFIKAGSNVMQFFDTVTLAPNEIPEIENNSKGEIEVSFIGQDGRPKKTRGVKFQERAQCQLHLISSEDYVYTLKDLYRGNVADEQKALVDIAYDLDRKIETLAWPYLQNQIGAFTLTGNRANRTYVVHSSINTNNLPTTNDIVLADNTETTKFRKEVFDAILKYCAAWGNAFLDGQLVPLAVYVPSSEVMDFLDQVDLTTQSNSLTDQIFETGFLMDYGGRKWNVIPDVTLDPKKGECYVRMNKSVGMFFTKPNMDETVDDTVTLKKQNKGSMYQQKAIGWGLPSTAKVNVVRVKYHDTRA